MESQVEAVKQGITKTRNEIPRSYMTNSEGRLSGIKTKTVLERTRSEVIGRFKTLVNIGLNDLKLFHLINT